MPPAGNCPHLEAPCHMHHLAPVTGGAGQAGRAGPHDVSTLGMHALLHARMVKACPVASSHLAHTPRGMLTSLTHAMGGADMLCRCPVACACDTSVPRNMQGGWPFRWFFYYYLRGWPPSPTSANCTIPPKRMSFLFKPTDAKDKSLIKIF